MLSVTLPSPEKEVEVEEEEEEEGWRVVTTGKGQSLAEEVS